MAKLKYNKTLVNNAIDELGDASNQLINTENDMRSALTIIANAQGIYHIHTDTLFNTLGYPSACQEMIEETINGIKKRASEIEEQNKKYENASFLEKLGSTAGLFVTKICEGIASAGEQIIDGFASILGMGVGLFSKDAQKSISNFIKKDFVGDFFNNLYATSLKEMVIKSWASDTSIACNIFKGIGTGLGYAAALAAGGAISGGLSTGTVAGAKMGAATLMSSLPAAATIAGVAGIGAGTQAGLKGGLDYNDAFCYGIKYGAIQAGTTVAFTLGIKALSKGVNLIKTKMNGTTNSTGLTVVNNTGTPPGGNPTAATTSAVPKNNYTFKSNYTAANGKTYTCLDDVWDDVVGGNLSKSNLRDIIKNTVGIDDSGIGHTFMSDALNVLKGKPPTAPAWKTFAEQMAGTADETMAAATKNMAGTGANTGTSMAGTVSDDIISSSSSTNSQFTQNLLESTSQTGTIQDVVESAAGAGVEDIAVATGTNAGPSMGGTVGDDIISSSSSANSQFTQDLLESTTQAGTIQDVVESTAGAGTDDMLATSVKKQLGSIRESMSRMGENLIKDKNAITAAQTALDDAIANGADDATIASLKKALSKAQKTYDGQYQRLLTKQQQYVDLTKNGQFDAVGTENYKLIVGDDVVAGPNSIDGNITTLRAGTTNANGQVEYRPNWTDASAKAEGQINARDFAKILDDQYGPVVKTPKTPTIQDIVESTAGTGTDDMIATSAQKQLGSIRESMSKMGENLIKDKNAITAAQTALDDAIANGADDATIASLEKTLSKAQKAYDGQYQRLLSKQQQYVDLTKSGQFDAVGTESYKLIVGDDVVAGPNSIDGNITTLRAGTTTANGTVEYRPNWTNATAKAEGQINARDFAKILDDQYGQVVPTPTAPTTALATIGPNGLATIPPTGSTAIAPKPPTGSTAIAPKPPTGSTAIATIPPTGSTAIAPKPPTGSTAIATIPPKGPTALVPTTPPGPIATIVPTIVPTVTVIPTVAPPITPVKGDTIIFGVVEPKEIVPTPSITIVPGTVIPVTTPPVIITDPPVIITDPPVITTPPVIITDPPVITTPPVIITDPPVITTPPVIITVPPAVTTAPPIVTTPPPITQEYVPIPNTGIGGSRSQRGFGVAPAVAGAVAGIAGIVGGSLLRGGSREKEEEESEE